MRLLQVRERNESMVKDWLLFLTKIKPKITTGEVYLAFEMAMTRELLQEDGKEFDLFPVLSNNQTAKIISAYLREKKNNKTYQSAKDELNKRIYPPKELTEDDKATINDEFIDNLVFEVKKSGYYEFSWLLFEKLKSEIKISKEDAKKMYKYQLKKYEIEENKRANSQRGIIGKQLKDRLKETLSSGNSIQIVQNRCRAVLVSDFIKNNELDNAKLKEILKKYEKQ